MFNEFANPQVTQSFSLKIALSCQLATRLDDMVCGHLRCPISSVLHSLFRNPTQCEVLVEILCTKCDFTNDEIKVLNFTCYC